MGNLITIYKGDENRAKIETKFIQGDFFDNVYDRACRTLANIVEETKEYQTAHKKNGYKIKYQGMGNNIIIFTAGRGQGKTSAMQSFAEYLRDPHRQAEHLPEIGSSNFTVLDAIDPSALDKKENIIRVLLSRLVFRLDKLYNGDKTLALNSEENVHERELLLKLLMDCYDNVEILKEDGKRNEDQDDLEHLAQLGNSAKLKENLHDLIEKFLKLFKSESRSDENYLVVQIDDVDLFTGDVHEICEDIHRYLSIPNVIVLMAADYTQLRYALCERYLKQYKELQNERSKVEIYKKCHDMATRYLEKVFPENNRIELPSIQDMTIEEYTNLQIHYIKNNADKNEEIIPPQNLCNYLLQKLYACTGVIILNTEEILHPLLPGTMRELTHFINLLNEMPEVDFNIICSCIYSEDADENQTERNNLYNNLMRLKQYFLFDWCTNYLDERQWDLIQKIEECDPKRKLKMTVSLLREYIKNTDKNADKNIFVSNKNYTYHEVMYEIEKNAILQEQFEFQYSLFIYYSIFLNEWFINVLLSTKDLIRFVDYVESPIFYHEGFSEIKFNGYVANHIKFTTGILSETMPFVANKMTQESTRTWLKIFCCPCEDEGQQNTEENMDSSKEAIKWVDDIWGEGVTANIVMFDVFNALRYFLVNSSWLRMPSEGEKIDLGLLEKVPKETEQGNNAQELVALKNIFANYEVQRRIQNDVEQFCKKPMVLGKKQVIRDFFAFYQNLFGILDQWSKQTDYEGNVGKRLYELFKGDKDYYSYILICYKENRDIYKKKCGNNIWKMADTLKKLLHEYKSTLTADSVQETVDTDMRAVPGDAVDWVNLYPEYWFWPRAIPGKDFDEINTDIFRLLRKYESLQVKEKDYLEEVQQKQQVDNTKKREAFQKELETFENYLDTMIKKYGENTSAPAKRKP